MQWLTQSLQTVTYNLFHLILLCHGKIHDYVWSFQMMLLSSLFLCFAATVQPRPNMCFNDYVT